MKTLVIGAAGFVGKYLTRELQSRGHEVVATKLGGEPLAGARALDIQGADDVQNTINDVAPDNIVHLAAQSSVALSWARPALTASVNIGGTLNILEAARLAKKPARLLLVGSGEEYGIVSPADCPIPESLPPNPQNIYSVTKAASNQLGSLYAKAYGLDIIMTRAFNHIGVGQADAFAVPSFCKQAAEIAAGKKEAVITVGNLAAKRDFADVRDIARGYALLLEKGIAGETYNLGSGCAIELRAILDKIIEISGQKIEIKIDEAKLRPIDAPVISADISKIKAHTGWQPKIPLEQSLEEIYNSYTNP